MIPISPTMRLFLQSWWDTKDNPRGQGEIPTQLKGVTASAKTGLCACLMFFCLEHDLDILVYGKELEDLFIAEGLNRNCPFHDGYLAYEEEAYKRESHLNPTRRAWVQKHLGIE